MTEPADCPRPGRPPAPRRRWRHARLLAALALAVVAGLLGPELWRVAFGTNWHVVLPGRVYRSAQLSRRRLEELTARYGVHTVINLRGCCHPEPWYVDECRATHQGGVCLEDVAMSASRYPSRTELRRLVEVFDHAEYPLLLHCRRGADRTGLAAAVVLLLQPDVSFAEARRQLGLRYGHVPLLHTGYLDAFYDLYADWLRARGQEHTPAGFRDWLLHTYRPGPCSAVFERCPSRLGPVPPGQPQAFAVRVRNDSAEPWHLRPTDNGGIHLGFILYDRAGKKITTGKAGVFEREVRPGESIDLNVVLPGIRKAGSYHLFLDMIEEGQAYFYQMGSEPCECEVRVGE
jgi:protein tyrosine phosphatase (PTP) superfamily phosphohydrolase (DUF442 family)